MKTFVMSVLLSFMLTSMATAQPPIDHVLLCGDEVIGVLSIVDGEVHAALVEGATCEAGELFAVAGEVEYAVTLTIDDDGVLIEVSIELEADADPMTAEAAVVPQEALDGMLKARENRAAAFERAAHGGEGRPDLPAAASHERGEGEPELPAAASHERGEERPELPEAATEERGEGRPDLPPAASHERGEERPELPEAAGGGRP